jgi:hypothetical protein
LWFEILRDSLKENLPALIPSVYLHYDPYAFREFAERQLASSATQRGRNWPMLL